MAKSGVGWTERVLYSINGYYGFDGFGPYGGLIFDASGNLYGTTIGYGSGTAFELTPTAGGGWTEKVWANFDCNGTDACAPYAGLIFGASGNLYGTTALGGAGGSGNGGTVFELYPNGAGGWQAAVLHSFVNNSGDGSGPEAGLISDAAGNLYGTTVNGGAYGYGTVFELTPIGNGSWTETVLHSFDNNHADGENPHAGLTLDAAGNLYGTTADGGAYGYGTVFEITP